MNEEIKKKRGRPPKNNGRNISIHSKFSPEECGILKEACGETGKSVSEFVRKATLDLIAKILIEKQTKKSEETDENDDSFARNWDKYEDDDDDFEEE